MFKDKSTQGWLKSLNKQIQIQSHLWQYYDKLYDLSPFMKTHPGGEQWLKLTQGQDITDYVQTYHIDISKVNALVGKYYVKDSPLPRKGLFDYQQNTLFVTMRNLALKHLPTRQSRKPTTEMTIIGWSIVLMCMLSFVLMFKHLNILTCLIYSYALFLMLGIGHNFSHQNHILKHCFDPTWITYKDWMVSHGLSHHTYPNTKLDLEITLFHPFIYILESERKNRPLVRVTQFAIFFLTPLQRMLNLIADPSQLKRKPEYLVMLLQPLLISYLGNNSLSASILYWYMAQGISAIILIFTTFPIHRTIQTWTQGNSQELNRDFGIHIMRTTSEHDLGLSTFKSFFLYLGFTDHVLHHMFPAIDKSRLVQLNPIFLELLKEKKLEKQLKLMKYPDIIQGYMKRLEP